MKTSKIYGVAIFFILSFFVYVKPSFASEGTVEMRSTTNEDYRCWVASIRMQNQIYSILVGCQNLLYPAGENIYSYVVWATPKEDDKPIKLGQLGYGKAQFQSKTPFSAVYVTTEVNPNVRAPEGPVVMRGQVETIRFLENPTTPTPTPTSTKEEEQKKAEETTQGKSLRERFALGLKRAGLAAVLAIVAIIGLVYILTRPR